MNIQSDYYKHKLTFEIDSSDVFDAQNNGENIIIIDARKTAAFETEHIPSSLNIPHRLMNVESTAHLDKAALYVTYCDGIGCNASTKGALNMAMLGFKVKELIGGLDWWKRDGYATAGTAKTPGLTIQCAC